ncbi:MAG: hypothetical protein ABGX05_10605 [Pirellulaceae bacterium]
MPRADLLPKGHQGAGNLLRFIVKGGHSVVKDASDNREPAAVELSLRA